MANFEQPNEFSIEAFDARARELSVVTDERERLMTELLPDFAFDSIPDLKVRAAVDSALHVEVHNRQSPTYKRSEIHVREQPQVTYDRLTRFEETALDPNEPVLYLRADISDRDTKLLLDGETTYQTSPSRFDHESERIDMVVGSHPKNRIWPGGVAAQGNSAWSGEDVRQAFDDDAIHRLEFIIGTEATAAYIDAQAHMPTEFDIHTAAFEKHHNIARLYKLIGLYGRVTTQYPDTAKHITELPKTMQSEREEFVKFAEDDVRHNLVYAITDPNQITDRADWDRAKHEKRLADITIPALRALRLGGKAFELLEAIDGPIMGTSKRSGRAVEVNDPHRCFPNGLTPAEDERRNEIREQFQEALA